MALPDRVHEEFQMVFFQISNLIKDKIFWKRQNCYTKNVAMAATVINFDGGCRELPDGANPNSLSVIEVEIKWFDSLILVMSLMLPYSFT